MKLDQETIEWISGHGKLIKDLKAAEKLVKYGKILLFYQNGKYSSMDICISERIT